MVTQGFFNCKKALALKLLLIVMVVCSSNPYSHADTGNFSSTAGTVDPNELETFIDEYVEKHMEAAHVPGLVLVIVQGAETLLSKGYGLANLENKIPMTPQQPVRVGSVSKPVTATAVIQLVEQGSIDLNSPVSKYAANLNLEDGFGQAGTIAQLLTHMSGYPDTVVLSHAPSIEDWLPLEQVLKSGLPARTIAPGKVMAYSSWDYALLGYAIGQVTGINYEEAMRKNLFDPLGMKNSTFLQPLPSELSDNLTTGYGYNHKDRTYEVVPHDFVQISPGVALVTTGEDMGAYMSVLVNGGVSNGVEILNEESLSLILERQASAHSYARGRSYAFTELNLGGRKVLNHDGNGIGFYSRMILLPEHQIGIFICTNHRVFDKNMSLTQAAVMVKRLSTEILKNFIPESERKIPDVRPLLVEEGRNKRYEGHYQSAGISGSDFFKIQALMDNVDVTANADGSLKIGSNTYVEVEPLVFQSKKHPHFFVVFVENADGKVEFLSFGGTGSYRKAGWYRSFSFSIALVGLTVLVFFSMFIIWPLTRRVHWLVWASSILNLLFLAGVGMLFTDMADLLVFYKRIPWGVRVLFCLPWINGVITLGLLLFSLKIWKNKPVPLWNKLHFLSFIAASFALFWFAGFWNLILK